MIYGVDVSEHQGVIDWAAAAAGGVQFAMVRAGWSWYDGGFTADDRFHENVAGAQAVGIPVGVYLYSYDLTPAAATKSAQAFLAALEPYRFTMPIAFDLEPDATRANQRLTGEFSPNEASAIAQAAMEEIETAGYYGILYSSMSWFETHLGALSQYDRWIAKWSGYRPTLPHGMWQYDVKGKFGEQHRDYQTYGEVPGVSANCDVNYAYKDYPSIIKNAGLNKLGEKDVAYWRNLYESEMRMRKELLARLSDLVKKYEGGGVFA